MKHKQKIRSSAGTYTAFAGHGILEESLKEILENFSTDKLFVLVDENVFAHHKNRIKKVVSSLTDDSAFLTVPQGEGSKSVQFWSQAMDFLLQNGARRNTPLLVIGGGVTGDLGGFAAASALRGLPLIHLPTTILAMVDSSIGGKTGINHQAGKNLIGSFYQPKAVIADTSFLNSLPRNEWINGLSEILKYGAIRDESIFSEAEIFLNPDTAAIPRESLIPLISRCIRIKADIVQEDEFEGGIRAFLNFGHTFAHALEKACDFNTISHGEAVFLGMLAARKLSVGLGGHVSHNYLDKFRSLYRYRVSAESLSYNDLTEFMLSDKKRTGEHITFVILKNWQHPALKTVNDQQLINDAWNVVFDEIKNHQRADKTI
jgi:3-dehydroquinate synthase